MCSYCNSTFGLILRYECIYLLRIACSAPFVRWDKQYIPFDIFFTLGSIFSWQKCRKRPLWELHSIAVFCIFLFNSTVFSGGYALVFFKESGEI